jgi:hypothetical protein
LGVLALAVVLEDLRRLAVEGIAQFLDGERTLAKWETVSGRLGGYLTAFSWLAVEARLACYEPSRLLAPTHCEQTRGSSSSLE